MNKILCALSLVFVFSLSAAMMSCESTKVDSYEIPEEEVILDEGIEPDTVVYNFNLYDNCPDDPVARLARNSIKSSDKNYKGVVMYTLEGTPTAEGMEVPLKYYSYCNTIRKTIEEGKHRLCQLSFNTSPVGNGIVLDFATERAAANSIQKMLDHNKSSVFAIYNY